MKTFSILDYGARTCDVPQTKQIQKAIDDCFLAGGGRVVIPCGLFLTGGLRLRSNVQLYLESGAILKGSRNPEDYLDFIHDTVEPVTMEEIGKTPLTGRSSTATSRWCNGLIRILDAENVSIVGEKGSYIDGSNTFDPQGEERYRGPHGISAWRCKNLHFEGYTFLHSANWCHAIFQSQNITVRKLSIYGGHDGVDIRTCDNVLIEDCLMHTGDDCVAGFDNHDVIVRNCDFQTACQIFRLGGNNILIENCNSTAPGAFGFRKNLSEEDRQACRWTDENCRHIALPAFSYYCDFRAVIRKTPGNIVVRNCSFDNIKEMFRLQFDGEHKWCCNRSLHDITFEDCEFLNLQRPGTLYGDKNEKVNFTLRRCRITANPEFSDAAILTCANFENITLEDVTFENYDKPTFLMLTQGPVDLIRTEGLTLEKAE